MIKIDSVHQAQSYVGLENHQTPGAPTAGQLLDLAKGRDTIGRIFSSAVSVEAEVKMEEYAGLVRLVDALIERNLIETERDGLTSDPYRVFIEGETEPLDLARMELEEAMDELFERLHLTDRERAESLVDL